MELKVKQLFALSILGGVLLGISFPFTGGLFPLAFFAFVPIILVNFQLNKRKKRTFFLRFSLNYCHFIIFNSITTWWIYNASPGGAYMAILANSLLMTLPFFLTGFIAKQLGENKGLLTLMVLWLSFEYGHYYWELSWPWLSFGHVFGTQPWLIQWYEYSGVTGGTLWVLISNILAYMIARNIWIRNEKLKFQTPIFLGFGIVLLLPIVSSVLLYATYKIKNDPVEIAIVQPNINAYTEKFTIPVQDQLDKIFKIAETGISESTDLILCPETAISRSVNEGYVDQENSVLLINAFLTKNHNIPMLIGADSYRLFEKPNSLASNYFEREDVWYEGYNSAFLIQPNQPTQIYHKAKPVLGAEKVPFLSWFPSLKQYSIDLGGTSGMIGLGEEPLNLEASGLRFAPLICYESVYGDYASYFTARGADILCVITNDGWWDDTPGYKQHRSFSQIRAIENRRDLARSANTGISCFINQKGEVVEELGWDVEGVIKAEMNKNNEITFFVRYGDVIGRISLFLALALFIYAISTYFKSKGLAVKK